MIAAVRAGLFAAYAVVLAVAASAPAIAADKPYQRADLADSAIRLEDQIKREAGQVSKPAATLRREADAAFARNDFRAGMQLLGQIVAVTPNDSANWLRLSRAVLQIRPTNARERTLFLERAGTAAYIAYQRAGNPGEEADALTLIGRTYAERRIWRPALDALRLSLGIREVAEVRQQYEMLRTDHGFRILDYSVDADSASPRACFQFSEGLPARRTDFSPFVAVEGQDKPALSVDARQLCVEGLKHGERYSITLRAGLPSVVAESLAKSTDYTVYVRDRKPFVRFSGRAYVLPRAGQHGIPVVSVNTKAVAVQIFRIGDRNLINTVLGNDFQRNLDRYEVERLANEQGLKVWSGELAVESPLNADVTTAFPVDQAVGTLSPGVYAMVAEPAGPRPDEYYQLSTQWFIVSDLGLSAFSGDDGIHVFVHSLASAKPSARVDVRLIARNNEVLATRRTDDSGYARFEAGLARGEGGLSPAMLVAADPSADYAFLNLKSAAFDLSDRGVAGRKAPAGLDGYVITERGVYRSGETVHVTALLRDSNGVAASGVPLTVIVERPDGVEYRRAVVADQGIGGRSLDVALVGSAPTGTWRVRAFTDPKRPPVGEATFMVEDYVPDRLAFELASPTGRISKTQGAAVTVDGRFLYGAPAAGLTLDGEIVVLPTRERPQWQGYQFGLADEQAEATREPIADLPNTDNQGKAQFNVDLEKVPVTTRPLQAQVVVRMAESGGRAVERRLTLPVTPAANMVGIKPLFSGKSLGDGQNATFDVILVAPDGKSLAAKGLRYELLKIESRYQWYRQDGRWNYEPVKLTRRIADGALDVAAGSPGRVSVPVTWGRYRLEVSGSDPDGPVTSVAFDAGFYADASADTPDLLEVALDKSEYVPGDTINVAVTARTAGQLTLNVVSDRLITTVSQEVPAGTARIAVPVGEDWGSGAYLVATLRRPLDEAARRMPGRAIGVQWFAVNRKARTLALELDLPKLIRPNSTLRIPVKLAGLGDGDEARIVVAAVDVGILNLTNYEAPEPDEYYFGQRRLSAEIRDLYGQLIDGMQGVRGQIRTGGDSAGAELQGSPPAQAPLALYSGLVTVGPDGAAEVSFDIPDFAGTARVMAIAWSKDKLGSAEGDVIIRDPVVVTATLPRFLLTGDRTGIHVDLDNVDGAAGDYRVTLRSDGPATIGGDAVQSLTLDAKQRRAMTVPVTASMAGPSHISIAVSGPNGFALVRRYALTVRPATQILTRRTIKPIARGESLTLSADLFADLVPGTGSVALSVGPSTALDAATLLRALDRYPFGCSEQIVSRALPLLYANDLAAAAHVAADANLEQRVKDSIDRILARQSANGSFGLWAVGGGDDWLDAYVTDFLTRARERGFAVPDVAFRLALDRLRNFVSSAPDVSKSGGRDLAYALYVLARNGVAPVGDLRYIADTKLNDVATPIAKAQIAAALGMLGDKVRADRVYGAALAAIPPKPVLEPSRADFGSALRDASALVTLASESNAPAPTIQQAVQRIEAARALSPFTSTQENAWMVLAARAIAKEADNVRLAIAGETHRGPLYRTVAAGALQASPLAVTNSGEATVQAVVSVSGAPLVPEPAAEKGFKIERLYFTLGGEPVDPATVKQNQRLAVVLRITEPRPQFGRIIVADYLPAGFEIDNPRLVSSGDTGTLSWIRDAKAPVHSEFRDDRFTAAFDRNSRDQAVFTVAYVVRAVSPGRYTLPQAFVEDMYQPDRFGRTGTGTIEVTSAR